MRDRSTIGIVAAGGLLGLALIAGAATVQRGEYRFDEVHSKVLVDADGQSEQVEAGALAHGGDVVRTGWRGRATVSADAVASRFEIFPGTRVRLASDKPGVIVLLERGRLKAMFDAVIGNDERIVETPGALLAVRGTRYGVEVDGSGDTIVSVFEGAVEVRPFDSGMAPLLVRPGEVSRFGPKQEPHKVMEGMTERTWNDRGGVRSMPEMKDGRDKGVQGDSARPDRDPSGMMGGTRGSQPTSGGGSKKPH